MPQYFHPFEPVVDKNSKVLILGSFPSFDSFEKNFYYANKYNQFWKIMDDIFKTKLRSKEDKIKLMLKNHIALWDVIKSCKRESSLDSKLKEIKLNNISAFLDNYSNIHKIGCNGRKSYDLLTKNFKDLKLDILYLPSTSPANAKVSYSQKLRAYKEFLSIHITILKSS